MNNDNVNNDQNERFIVVFDRRYQGGARRLNFMQEKKDQKGDGNKGKKRVWSDAKWINREWIEITREDYNWLIEKW